jgi:integrase
MRAIRHSEELPQRKKKAILLKDLAKRYLEWATGVRRNGAIDDKNRYERHVKPRFEDIRVNEISTFSLEKMKADMMKDGLSPQSAKLSLSLLRAMINRAREWGLYQGENPVSKIKMPRPQNERQRFLTHEEASKLLDYLKNPPPPKGQQKDTQDPFRLLQLHDIVLLSLFTACRAGEAFNLRGRDVNFQTGVMSLVDTKNSETRHVPMTESVRDMFRRRMPEDKNDFIFKSRTGGKIKEVSHAFDRAVEALGFNANVNDRRQKVVFHSLRHTALSWAAMNGASLRTLAELAGHKGLDMVKRYSHLTESHMRDVMTGLQGAFEKATEPMRVKGNEGN